VETEISSGLEDHFSLYADLPFTYTFIILELLHNATSNDLASSVVNLLRGAGLLGNLAEIAEKKRAQDEHLLTDKLEMVKGMVV